MLRRPQQNRPLSSSKSKYLGALKLFLLVSTIWAPVFGQPHCTVNEDRTWWTQTARFSVDFLNARLTLPTIVFQSTPPTVFLEVQGDAPELQQQLFLEFLGAKVPVENGAALPLEYRFGERLQFTLITGDGQPLCSWQPSFRSGWRQGSPPSKPETFSDVESWTFRNTGEPIALWVGGNVSRKFTIGGLPAMVLSYARWQVILRDPRPAAGLRIVASNGFAVQLRFIDVEVKLSKPSANGHATLVVRVPHLDLWGRRLCSIPFTSESTCPLLRLFNFSTDAMSIGCGKSVGASPSGEGNIEYKVIQVTRRKIRDGALVVSCPVRFRTPQPAKIDVELFESPPIKRAHFHIPFVYYLLI